MIDIGCGKYGDVLGIYLGIDVAKKLYPHLKIKSANIMTDQIEGQYNVMVPSEVIELLGTESQLIHVRRCYELLGQGGYLILTTPNKLKEEEIVTALLV